MTEKTSRILVFSTAYAPHIGGAELALAAIIERLPRAHFDIITAQLASKDVAYESINNTAIYRVGGFVSRFSFFVPKLFFPVVAFFQALRLTYRFGRYDRVFALQASQGAGAAWLYHLVYSRTPFIVNLQEGKDFRSQNFFVRFFRKILIRSADIVTVISHYLKDYVLGIGVLPEKVIVIPNGIDEKQFYPADTDECQHIRRELEIPTYAKVIVSVSRLVPKNGIDILIHAFAKLPRGQYFLLLVGDGEDRVMLENMVAHYSLEREVHFLGRIEHADLRRYIVVADAFVRPSRSEGLGTSFLEAMACGLPIIAPRVGGIADFLHHKKTGLVMSPENPHSLAEMIREMFYDNSLRTAIVESAHDMVKKHYTWDIIARSYSSIFNL